MSDAKLSDAKIQLLCAKTRPLKASDGRGLYILVNPNGSHYWRFKYRYGGREKCISFGVYPAVSIKSARSQRDQARQLLRAHKDPSQERQAQKQKMLQSAAQPARESDFEAWFVIHHGVRPGADRGPDHELMAMVNEGKFAQLILDQRRTWDDQHRSALYAWRACK